MSATLKKLDDFQFNLLALAVAAAVASHMAHLPAWLNMAMLALFALRCLQRRWRPSLGSFPWWLRLPLTLALPVALLAQYGNLFGRDPGSALAAGMLVMKLCESEKPRDAKSAITFGCFLLMAALLFDQSLPGTLLVGLCLVPQFAALRALQREDNATAGMAATRVELAGAGWILVAALPLATAAFLFLPRLTSPLWGAPLQEVGKTGIGNEMSPGSLTELLIDDSPAFRVDFDGPRPNNAQQYWRGKVLWEFDGLTWHGLPAGSYGDNGQQPLQVQGPLLRYNVTLEPTRQNKLYVLDMPAAAPEGARLDLDLVVSAFKRVDELRRYRAEAALNYRLGGLTQQLRERALRLPPGYNPRAQALAREWRSRANSDMDVVRAALSLFNRSFTYTLTPPLLGRDSMDDFLFETRAGYCEHFASAFTVLMRAAGIPARVVIGYQGGYWNAFGDYLVMRQSDAHAWSEIWLPDSGWVRIDPTGAVNPARVQLGAQSANGASKPWYSAEWLLALRNRWDIVNRFWNDAIVRFDALRQSSLLTPFGVDKAESRDLGIALLIAGIAFMAAALWWALRRERPSGDALDRAYARLAALLARRGLAADATEGPRAYATRACAAFAPAATELDKLFDTYIDLRYARLAASPADVERFSRAVADLSRRKALLARVPSPADRVAG